MCRSDVTIHQTVVPCSPQTSNESQEVKAPAQGEPKLPETRKALDLSRSLSVFLLDWDDTLFPTTALSSLGPELLDEALKAVDTTVAELLSAVLAIPNGRLIILTNANITWVYHSAATFLPKVDALLRAQEGRVLLISAHREKSQLPEVGTPAYDDAIRRGKSERVRPLAATLRQVLKESQAQSLQVISIGDQPHDLAAGHALRNMICSAPASIAAEESFVKTVLMKPRPAGMELVKQLDTLCRSLKMLVSMPRSIHQCMSPAPERVAARPVEPSAEVQIQHPADTKPPQTADSSVPTSCASDAVAVEETMSCSSSRPVESQCKVCV